MSHSQDTALDVFWSSGLAAVGPGAIITLGEIHNKHGGERRIDPTETVTKTTSVFFAGF